MGCLTDHHPARRHPDASPDDTHPQSGFGQGRRQTPRSGKIDPFRAAGRPALSGANAFSDPVASSNGLIQRPGASETRPNFCRTPGGACLLPLPPARPTAWRASPFAVAVLPFLGSADLVKSLVPINRRRRPLARTSHLWLIDGLRVLHADKPPAPPKTVRPTRHATRRGAAFPPWPSNPWRCSMPVQECC